MKITALAENTSGQPDIGCEHGLSLYIETASHKILFDMGQTGLFAENAARLGVDLSAVDLAVLSHGHYDHGGGLATFLRINHRAPVFVNEHAFEPHYNGTDKYIGLDTALQHSDRLVLTGEKYPIDKGLTLYACNERQRPFVFGAGTLLERQNGQLVPEAFRHEHYLLIEETGKRVLISGCSHKGILNIAAWFRPDVLVGGFHLMKLEREETLRGYAEQLDAFPTTFYTCHCTGVQQYAWMQPHMQRLHYMSAGETIIL